MLVTGSKEHKTLLVISFSVPETRISFFFCLRSFFGLSVCLPIEVETIVEVTFKGGSER